MIIRAPGRFPRERTDSDHIRNEHRVRRIIKGEQIKTYRLPIVPKPFTIPIAADRLAGGRGMAFDTHTNVNENPVESMSDTQDGLGKGTIIPQ